MRFFDILKISIHNIYHNKVRTLITVIIVFVVSLLIMVISILGISFYQSIDNAYMDLYDKTGAQFNLNNYNNYNETVSEYRSINKNEYETVMSQFSGYPELIDNVKIEIGNSESYYLYDTDTIPNLNSFNNNNNLYNNYNDFRYSIKPFSSYGDLDYESKGINYLKDGRLWSKDDEGLKKIWVSERFIAKASSYGKQLCVGDYAVILCCNYVVKENNYYEPEYSADRFKISGIFLDEALKDLNYSSDIFMDIETMYNLVGDKIEMNNLLIINEPKVGYIFNTEYKKMKTIVDNVNKVIGPNNYNGKEEDRFKCDIVSNLKMVRLMGSILIGATFFIGFVILIISIGSVANTIIISVDKNKRFLGVMMAVGLKKGGVKRIVEYETLLTIIISTGLSYLILFLLKGQFLPIMKSLLLLIGFTTGSTIVMPIYLPVVVIFAFIFMALLFAKNSLAKITNMDVISVISEVS